MCQGQSVGSYEQAGEMSRMEMQRGHEDLYRKEPSENSSYTSWRRTCPSHLHFRCFIVLMIQRFSLTRFRTSELLTFAVQLIFSIFLHIHVSNASILFISVLDIVHVCAAYKATLHTRHLTTRFLKSSFILLVRIFFQQQQQHQSSLSWQSF